MQLDQGDPPGIAIPDSCLCMGCGKCSGHKYGSRGWGNYGGQFSNTINIHPCMDQRKVLRFLGTSSLGEGVTISHGS